MALTIPQAAGAIYNTGTLTLNDSDLNRNFGTVGGINNAAGTVLVNRSTFTGNDGGNGGAINNSAGTLTVNNSTFYDNHVAEWGGAINNASGTLTVSGSTFYDNHAFYGGAISVSAADTYGGGGHTESSGTLRISNTTFAGNSAAFSGGAIHFASTSPQQSVLTNVTVVNNRSNTDLRFGEPRSGSRGGEESGPTRQAPLSSH